MAMRAAIYVLLMCFCTLEAAADTSSSTAVCVKPRGKVCTIRLLTEDTTSPTSLLPDLSDRVELQVAAGQVKALTEANTRSSNMEKLRILRLEALGLESVFVREHFEELQLSGNRIVNLTTAGTGTGSYRLRVLDLRKNQFADVTQLQPFERMVELKLDDNQITVLWLEPFTRMSQLRVLSLAGNKINQIVPSTTVPFELGELEYLSLARNELVSFGMADWQLPSLKTLLLNDNRLVELPDVTDFERFFSLEHLALGANDWSCRWLDSVLGGVLKQDSIKLDVGVNTECPSEKVGGICCKFSMSSTNDSTALSTATSSELFVPEIRQAREQTEKLAALHDEFNRSWDERLAALHAKLQNMLVVAIAELQVKQPVTLLQVAQLREELDGLRNQTKTLEKEKELHRRMEKRLAHFMIEMKNKLLQQTIETDKLSSQVNQLRYSFDQQFNERTKEDATNA